MDTFGRQDDNRDDAPATSSASPMAAAEPPVGEGLAEAAGVVVELDAAARSLRVRLRCDRHANGTADADFDIAPDCIVRVNGEPARLRMIQPRDRVRIGYRPAAPGEGRPTAHRLEAGAGLGRGANGGRRGDSG